MADLAQITCTHGCRLLKKHSKVKIASRERSIKCEMGIIHCFLSKHTIYDQADPQVWPKVTNSGATLAQITCVHGCRHLQKISKVKIGSQERITMTGMGIVHCFFIQTPNLRPSWPPNLARNDQFWGYSGPNNMCTWLETAAEAFQIPNCLTSNDHDDWNGNCTWHFNSTTTFSTKLTPNFGQKRAAPGLIWHKWYVQMVADCCGSTLNSKLVYEQGL